MKSLFIPRTYIDWSYEEGKEKQNDYKFIVGKGKYHFRQGDRVCLIVYGRPDYQFGIILQVEEECLVIHIDEWLDISEEYSIVLVSEMKQTDV